MSEPGKDKIWMPGDDASAGGFWEGLKAGFFMNSPWEQPAEKPSAAPAGEPEDEPAVDATPAAREESED